MKNANRPDDIVARPLRMSRSLYGRLKMKAKKANRSANAEIVVAIEKHVGPKS